MAVGKGKIGRPAMVGSGKVIPRLFDNLVVKITVANAVGMFVKEYKNSSGIRDVSKV